MKKTGKPPVAGNLPGFRKEAFLVLFCGRSLCCALCGSLGSFGGGSLLGFFGGSCGSGLLLGDGLCALLLDLGLGSQACFLGRLGIRGELVALGLDLTGLLAQPFVEAGFGFGLRECALGDTA